MQTTDVNAAMNDASGFLMTAARKIGLEVTEHALKLIYTVTADATPAKIKAAAVAPLVYLLSPVDALPDVVPFVGFTDDAVVLTAAIAALHLHITDDIVARAKAQARRIFG